MNIGFYNPYFDSLGGGERYVFTLAGHWSKAHTVSIFWDDPMIIAKAQARFHLDLSAVKTVPNIFNQPLVNKVFASTQYDLIFFLSDGSIPTSFATHNILHFQVPFQHVSLPFWKKMKIDRIICNSEFTKLSIDQSVGKLADVIYPPVDIETFNIGKKEKIILSVGRFSSAYQAKKQEVLIDIFIDGVKNGMLKDWELVLAGGVLPSDQSYLEMLKKRALGYAITFLPNTVFETLQKEYSRATIYWHAAGFGETSPQYMEHFGITTVEAMASGCIPIVFNGGGQPEIVEHGKNGYLWKTKEGCLDLTRSVIHLGNSRKQMQNQAILKSKAFSIAAFNKKFDTLLPKT